MLRFAVFLALIAAPASAQTSRNCLPRDELLQRLAAQYKETRKALGVGANGSVIEIFSSDESGSFTIAVTLPNGLTCLVAAGQYFEMITEVMVPEGEKL